MADQSAGRNAQYEYSQLQPLTKKLDKRRAKAAKIVAVVQHFLGRRDLAGLTALDVGCSTGFTVKALADAGATAFGVDIDAEGLGWARAEVDGALRLAAAEGSALPLRDQSVDIAVFNHIYEHVVDPEAVLAEIRRVLKSDGMVYFGFGNKHILVEPHYRLPFLSWVPQGMADHYMQLTGHGDIYHERFQTRRGLVRMCRGLNLWDYTYAVLAAPDVFDAKDMVSPRMSRLPMTFWRMMQPIIPTFLWIGTPGGMTPRGSAGQVSPVRIPIE